MSAPVLFDLPGPKARARIRIATVIGTVLVVALVAFVLFRLGRNGQLDPQRWSVLFDPASGVPQALGQALLRTLRVAAVAMVFATVLGLLLAVGRLSDHRSIRRTACGSSTRRMSWLLRSPRPDAASACPRSTETIPARKISASTAML